MSQYMHTIKTKAKRVGLFSITLCLLTLPSAASLALGLSTFRIYLDNDKRQDNFVVYSKDEYTQHCNLSLRHYDVLESGKLLALDSGVEPEKSASKWIRFSPKKFSLKPGTSQSVKFQMRRKANTLADEFRSFLSVDCEFDAEELNANNDRKTGMTPRLRHNIPVIVRTGKLAAELAFENLEVNDELVSFNLKRSGERSIHGRVQLIDTRNDKIVNKKSLFSLYTETPFKNVRLATMGVDKKYLLLRFQEEADVGGTISINQQLM
jgi:hypothetical protein